MYRLRRKGLRGAEPSVALRVTRFLMPVALKMNYFQRASWLHQRNNYFVVVMRHYGKAGIFAVLFGFRRGPYRDLQYCVGMEQHTFF